MTGDTWLVERRESEKMWKKEKRKKQNKRNKIDWLIGFNAGLPSQRVAFDNSPC